MSEGPVAGGSRVGLAFRLALAADLVAVLVPVVDTLVVPPASWSITRAFGRGGSAHGRCAWLVGRLDRGRGSPGCELVPRRRGSRPRRSSTL